MSLENRKRLDFAQNYFKQRIKEVFAVFTLLCVDHVRFIRYMSRFA
jgi:hypothetical protein